MSRHQRLCIFGSGVLADGCSVLGKSAFEALNGRASVLIVTGIVTRLGPGSMEAAVRRSFLVGLDTDPMIYSRSEALLAAKVLFGCLYADVAK
jgi:hypothetical protein